MMAKVLTQFTAIAFAVFVGLSLYFGRPAWACLYVAIGLFAAAMIWATVVGVRDGLDRVRRERR